MDSDVKLEVTSSAPLSDLNSAVQHALLEQTVPLRRVSVACASCRKSHVCCDNSNFFSHFNFFLPFFRNFFIFYVGFFESFRSIFSGGARIDMGRSIPFH